MENVKKMISSNIEENNKLEEKDRIEIGTDITPEIINSKNEKSDLDNIENTLNNIKNKITEKITEILRNECITLLKEVESFNLDEFGNTKINLSVKEYQIQNSNDDKDLEGYKSKIITDKKRIKIYNLFQEVSSMNNNNDIGVDIENIEKKENEELENIEKALNDKKKQIEKIDTDLKNYSNEITAKLKENLAELKKIKNDFSDYFYNKISSNLKLECSKKNYFKDDYVYKFVYLDKEIFTVNNKNIISKEDISKLEFILQEENSFSHIKKYKVKLSDILESIFAVDKDFLEIFEFVEKNEEVDDNLKNFLFIKLKLDNFKICFYDMHNNKYYKFYNNKLDYYNKPYKCVEIIGSSYSKYFKYITIDDSDKIKRLVGANKSDKHTDERKIVIVNNLIDNKSKQNKLNDYLNNYLFDTNIIEIIKK